MRGIRMRFEEQPGLCPQDPPEGDSRRHPPRPGEAPGSRLRPAQRPRPAARRLKALNDRKRMSLKTWAGFRVSADNAHGVIRPTGRSGCRRAPGPPESLAGTGHRTGVQLADSACTSPNIACRRSRQASHRVRSSSRRMPARISIPRRGSARRRACSSSLARPAGAGANGSAALDGMQGRGAALDIALAELAFELGEEVLHVRNEAPQHLDDQLQAAAETPDDIAPRLDQFARVRCRCRRAWRRSCRDDRAGKAPGAPCRSASPHGRSCPPPGGFAVGQRGVGGHGGIGSPAKRPSARILRVASRPSISGICMSISTASNGTLASSTC